MIYVNVSKLSQILKIMISNRTKSSILCGGVNCCWEKKKKVFANTNINTNTNTKNIETNTTSIPPLQCVVGWRRRE